MHKQIHQPQGRLDTLEGLQLPRRSLEIAALSFLEVPDGTTIVTAQCASTQFATQLKSPLGTLITAFEHGQRAYVVRFAAHGHEISVLPAGNEEAGLSNNSERLFVSTVPTDLGHFLLTPFRGTGLSRFLTQLAVEHALASTGYATANVRFAQIRNILEKCGLTEIFRIPMHTSERLEAQAFGREQASKGFKYDYEGAKLLEDTVVMSRSIPKEEREKNQHWDLSSSIRLIERRDGMHKELRLPL